MVGDDGSIAASSRGTALIIEDDGARRQLLDAVLRANGYEPVTALLYGNDVDAEEARADIVIANTSALCLDRVATVRRAQRSSERRRVPTIFLAAPEDLQIVHERFNVANDAFIQRPLRLPELVARLRSLRMPNLEPKPFGRERRTTERDGRIGEERPRFWRSRPSLQDLLTEPAFEIEYGFEAGRADSSDATITLAHVEIFEMAGILETAGTAAVTSIAREISFLLAPFESVSRVGVDQELRLLLLLREDETQARQTLSAVARTIVAHRFHVSAGPIRLTPIVGFVGRTRALPYHDLRRCSLLALAEASLQLDLEPMPFATSMEVRADASRFTALRARVANALRPAVVPLQLLATITGALLLPFLAYVVLAMHGIDFTNQLYIAFVIVLALTSAAVCWESILAFRDTTPASATFYPPASAIVAAYLPNEVATIVETVEAFLRVDYPGALQIVVAYNTPRPLPMEEELRSIAERDPRLVLLRVDDSTSKAQNVNAALRIVNGTFVGVFDADHKPESDSFRRAWDWLASGYDVVQGRCLIRNAADSLMAQLVAIEFETIYAVSHPGRTRMHGFGLFGGSNGYWKTDLLRQTRMHRFMLTEDIDSSLRVLAAGYRIATDRNLISRELAPITTRAFWHQRLRWAQGWFRPRSNTCDRRSPRRISRSGKRSGSSISSSGANATCGRRCKCCRSSLSGCWSGTIA